MILSHLAMHVAVLVTANQHTDLFCDYDRTWKGKVTPFVNSFWFLVHDSFKNHLTAKCVNGTFQE